MEQFGDYEATKVIGLGPTSTVMLAPDGLAVKAMSVHGSVDPQRDTDTFLLAAAIQKQTTTGNAVHWAPVHAIGVENGSPYLVTRAYRYSCQRLIEGRVRVGAGQVHAIIRQVVEGLDELARIAGRPHGNLKPSNVLLLDPPRSTRVTVALCDPRPTIADAAAAQADDRRAVGAMIYELVTREPWRGRVDLPVTASAFATLGPDAERWRDLANRLLDPALAPGDGSIARLRAEIAELKPKPRRKPFYLSAAVTAVALAIGLWCLGRPPPPPTVTEFVSRCDVFDQWTKLTTNYSPWVDEHDELTELTADLKINDPLFIIGKTTDFFLIPLKKALLGKLDNEETKRRLKEAEHLLAVHSTKLEQARNAMVRWTEQAQTWCAEADRIAADLEQIKWNEAAVLNAPAELLRYHVEEGRTILEEHAKLLRPRDENAWDDLGDASRPLAPHLAVVIAASKYGADAIRLHNDLASIAESVSGHKIGGARLEEYVNASIIDALRAFPSVASSENAIPTASAFKALFDRVSADHRIAEDLDELLGDASKINDDIDTLVNLKDQKKANEFQGQWDIAINKLESLPWSDGKAGATIQSELETLKGTIETLKVGVGERIKIAGRDRETEIKIFLAMDPPGGSTALADAWREHRQKVIDNTTAVIDLYEGIQGLRMLLQDVDGTFTTEPLTTSNVPKAVDEEAVQAALKRRREEAITEVVMHIHYAGSHVPEFTDDGAALVDAKEEFKKWRRAAAALLDNYALIEDYLDALYDLNDILDGSQTLEAMIENHKANGPWQDLSQALEPVYGRVENLKRLAAETDVANLVTKAGSQDDNPAIHFAAWRRLRKILTGSEASFSVASLNDIAAIRTQALNLAGQVQFAGKPAPDRHQTLTVEIHQGAEEIWRAYLNAASTEDDVGAVVEIAPNLIDGFDLATFDPHAYMTASVAPLTPQARWNLILYQQRNAAFDGQPDHDIKLRVEHLVDRLKNLDLYEARKLGEQLDDLVADDSNKRFGGFDKFGPAAGWVDDAIRAALPEDSQAETVAFSLPGVPQQIVFRRVALEGQPPVYLSTSEVSVGFFVAVLRAAGKMAEVQKTTWPTQVPKFPRSWDFDGKELTTPKDKGWLVGNTVLDAKPNLFAGEVNLETEGRTANSPMQSLPPWAVEYFAGLVGCRLPTVAEWNKAVEQADALPRNERQEPNLRDQTWLAQHDHMRDLGIAGYEEWPDKGSFYGEGLGQVNRNLIPFSDGYAYFAPVNLDSQIFEHLTGNVAEYVKDETDGASLAVIGGSAMSYPHQVASSPLEDLFNARNGYSDVGFRLAFTAGKRELSERLRELIGRQTFLPPANSAPPAP